MNPYIPGYGLSPHQPMRCAPSHCRSNRLRTSIHRHLVRRRVGDAGAGSVAALLHQVRQGVQGAHDLGRTEVAVAMRLRRRDMGVEARHTGVEVICLPAITHTAVHGMFEAGSANGQRASIYHSGEGLHRDISVRVGTRRSTSSRRTG